MAKGTGVKNKASPASKPTKALSFAPKSTTTKPMALVASKKKSGIDSTKRRIKHPSFAICLDDRDESDLKMGRVYRVIDDAFAAEVKLLRIVDDSGEDYLYPRSDFRVVRLPIEIALRSLRIKKSSVRKFTAAD